MQAQLARYDRSPFQNHLAVALSPGIAPSMSAWRRMAKKDPEKWSRSITMLAKAAGFADKSERINVNIDPGTMAKELVARFGHTRALSLLSAAGLPTDLIPTVNIDRLPIEHSSGNISGSTNSEVSK